MGQRSAVVLARIVTSDAYDYTRERVGVESPASAIPNERVCPGRPPPGVPKDNAIQVERILNDARGRSSGSQDILFRGQIIGLLDARHVT